MQGRRRPDTTQDAINLDSVAPGDYWRMESGEWWIKPPRGYIGRLGNHTVVEHEDGTITVTPSILVQWGSGSWHGYLTRGEWTEC